jgi:hypothetical protein
MLPIVDKLTIFVRPGADNSTKFRSDGTILLVGVQLIPNSHQSTGWSNARPLLAEKKNGYNAGNIHAEHLGTTTRGEQIGSSRRLLARGHNPASRTTFEQTIVIGGYLWSEHG